MCPADWAAVRVLRPWQGVGGLPWVSGMSFSVGTDGTELVHRVRSITVPIQPAKRQP